jgi:hypothetical protein
LGDKGANPAELKGFACLVVALPGKAVGIGDIGNAALTFGHGPDHFIFDLDNVSFIKERGGAEYVGGDFGMVPVEAPVLF